MESTRKPEEADPDLDLLGGDSVEEKDRDQAAKIRQFVNVMVESHGRDTIQIPIAKGTVSVSREAFLASVAEALDEAVELAGADVKNEKSLEGPIRYVREARQRAQRGYEAFMKAKDKAGFNTGKFKYEVKHLEDAVDALRKELDKVKPGS